MSSVTSGPSPPRAAHPPTQGVTIAHRTGDAELEPVGADHSRRRREAHVPRRENGDVIADTERLEVTQERSRLSVTSSIEISASIRSRKEIFRRQPSTRDLVESTRKVIDAGCLDRHARGGGVSAEPHEQVAALDQAGVQVERCRRAPGPLPTSPSSAMSTVGRAVSSTMRDATMPITPGCHPCSASTIPYVLSRSSASTRLRAAPGWRDRSPAGGGSFPRASRASRFARARVPRAATGRQRAYDRVCRPHSEVRAGTPRVPR